MPCFYLVVLILEELSDGGEHFYAHYKSGWAGALEEEGIFPPTFSHSVTMWVPWVPFSTFPGVVLLCTGSLPSLPQCCKIMTH